MLPGLHADPGDIYILLLFYKLKQENMKKILLSALAVILSSTAFAQTEVSVGIERPRLALDDGSWIFDTYNYWSETAPAVSADGLTATFYQSPELQATLVTDAASESGYATTDQLRYFGTSMSGIDYYWKLLCTQGKASNHAAGTEFSENFAFGFDLEVAAGTEFKVSGLRMNLLVENNPVYRVRILKEDGTEVWNSKIISKTSGYNSAEWGYGRYAYWTADSVTFLDDANYASMIQYFTKEVCYKNAEDITLLPADFVLGAGKYRVVCDFDYEKDSAKGLSFDYLKLEGTVTGGSTPGGSEGGNKVGIERPRFTMDDGSWIFDTFAYWSETAPAVSADGITATFYQSPELQATLVTDAASESGYATTDQLRYFGTSMSGIDYYWKLLCTQGKASNHTAGTEFSENFAFGFDLEVADGKAFKVNGVKMNLLVENNPVYRVRILKEDGTELWNSKIVSKTSGYNSAEWGYGRYAYWTADSVTFLDDANYASMIQYFTKEVCYKNAEDITLLPADFVLGAGKYRVVCDFDYEKDSAKGLSFDYFVLEVEATDPAGIDGVITDNVVAPVNSAIYSIDGRMIGTNKANLVKGIYIQNGKKFVVK